MADRTSLRRLRILTWHVHGNYLLSLSQVPHDLLIVTRPGHPPGWAGRGGALPFGANVIELPATAVAGTQVDCVLYQSRIHWDEDRLDVLDDRQRALPAICLEHDPPRTHPTDAVHWFRHPRGLLVQVTPFNALMWDAGDMPVRVIEHGVSELPDLPGRGELPRGIVVVNDLRRRGRRLGLDVFEQVRTRVPLDLIGMGACALGGLGELPNPQVPAFVARRRFLFNPIRWTSLGLAVVEAMAAGVPVVALATTELPTVIRNGESGWVDTRPDRLVDVMNGLIADPDLARRWGDAARRTARERFGMSRFVADWCRTFDEVVGETR